MASIISNQSIGWSGGLTWASTRLFSMTVSLRCLSCNGYDMPLTERDMQRARTEDVLGIYAERLKLSFDQLLRNKTLFLNYWAADKLDLEGTNLAKMIKIEIAGERVLALKAYWFNANIMKELKDVGDCCKATVRIEIGLVYWDNLLYSYLGWNKRLRWFNVFDILEKGVGQSWREYNA